MFGWSSGQITSAATPDVYFTDKPQLVKYLKSTIDSYQPDIGLVLVYLIIDGSWGKVVLSGGNHPYHCPSLGGKLIAIFSQCGDNLSFGESHGKP